MNAKDLREDVVRPVLKVMDKWSEAAENLVLGTAAKESAMGQDLRQRGGGPALGIYQMEPATHTWLRTWLERPVMVVWPTRSTTVPVSTATSQVVGATAEVTKWPRGADWRQLRNRKCGLSENQVTQIVNALLELTDFNPPAAPSPDLVEPRATRGPRRPPQRRPAAAPARPHTSRRRHA